MFPTRRPFGPLIFPVRRFSRRQEEWGPICLVFFPLGFCFHNDVNEVVAAMTLLELVLLDLSIPRQCPIVRRRRLWKLLSPDLLLPLRSWQLVCLSRRAIGWIFVWKLQHLLMYYSVAWFVFSNPLNRWWWFATDAASTVFRSLYKWRVAITIFKASYRGCICRLLEICPRGNNIVLLYFLFIIKSLYFML